MRQVTPVDFTARYGLTPTHSEVVAALAYQAPGRALDLGCGQGRNTLYLNQHGFQVTAWDKNSHSIARLNQIIADQGLSGITSAVADLNTLTFGGEYDFILCTVVMMFLEPSAVPRVIANMQSATRPGGHNLIVAAMDTPDYPCHTGFPFTFKTGELKDAYHGWQRIKYNEDVGHLHKTDASGKPIPLRFATLLARKPD